MAQDIVSKIQAAAQANGIDPDVALRIAGVESSYRPGAKNPKSSAKGLFQVTNDTWKDYGGAPGKAKNVDENIRVGMKIMSSNKDSMQKFLGHEPLPSDIYAAHFFGPTGARSVMSGDPLAQVSSVVSKEVMRANPQLAGKTANEVLTGFRQKFDGAAKRYPTSEPMKTTTAAQGSRATQPKMDQEAGAAAPALSARSRIAGMGANYQAALAAMMLAEAAEEDGEDDGVAAKEPEEKAYVAPVAKNALADMDFGPSSSPFDAMEPAVTPPGMKFPMQFAKGGDVADEYETFKSEFANYKTLDPRAAEEAAFTSKNITVKTDPDNPDRAIPNKPRDQLGRAGQELLDFLEKTGKMPTVVESRRFPSGGYEGPAFQYIGSNDEDAGVVRFPSFKKDPYSSLVHELTHAADRSMMLGRSALLKRSNKGEDISPEDQRFLDGYTKLYKEPTKLPLNISDDDLTDRQKKYRTDDRELRAFGVGNMAQDPTEAGRYNQQDMGETLNPHVDPTMATEAAIMRELYLRSGAVRGRAEGSPPEGEYADPEAAFMAGSSDAPAPRAGGAAAALAAIRGLGEYPYNLVGGGVDLATMAMRPFGYDAEKPVMGSDWIKEKATQLGIRPPEETDPTLRDIRLGTEIATSALDPFAGARAVGSMLRGAGDLATSEPARAMLDKVMKAGGTEPMYAVRPPGGYMLQQPAEVAGGLSRPVDNPLGGVDKMMNNAYRKLIISPGNTEQVNAVSKFLMNQGRQYFSKNYASTSDPLYTALKDGRVLPLKSDERSLRGYMIKAGREGDPDALEDMARTYDGGLQSYSLAGDPIKTGAMQQSMLERTRVAGEKAGLTPGEASSSNMMYDANYFPNMKEALEQGVPEVMQAQKYDDPVFDVVDYRIPQFMNPEKMVDELLQIPVDKLENMSYPEAVIAANKNMRFMEDFEAAAARVKQGKPVPKQVMLFGTEKFDTASENKLLSWYKLNDSKAALMEGNAMGHSVGGYNRYGNYNEGGKAAFDSGVVEIYSLRDQKGMPSATVELVTRKNDEGTPMRLVTDIKGIYNSRPLSDGDIFSLFDEIKPDHFSNRATNGPTWHYFEDNLNQPLDVRVDVDYREAYEAYKKGDVEGFAKGGLVERSVYNHQKYL